MSNQVDRVDRPISEVTGPLVGDNLLNGFKLEILKEPVFQTMFGIRGERVFTEAHPNVNETILPALLMEWKQETFNSSRAFFEGNINAMIVLPVRLDGDTNALRRVGSMLQRWMSGGMNLFDPASDSWVPGLVKFGYGAVYDYSGLAQFTGFSAPVIQINIPFTFDLELLRIQSEGTDFNAPLDDSDVDFVTDNLIQFFDPVLPQELTQEDSSNV